MDADNGLRVLIVEGEWLIAESLADQLTEQRSVVVGPASGVRATLDLVLTQPMDRAVLDLSATPRSARNARPDRRAWLGGGCAEPRRHNDLLRPFRQGGRSSAFYELFALGVWYIPPEIVHYMVERIDRVLRDNPRIWRVEDRRLLRRPERVGARSLHRDWLLPCAGAPAHSTDA